MKKTGPLFILFAAILFSLGGLMIKSIDWNAMAINGARNVLAVVVFGAFLLITKHKLVINKSVLIGALSVAATTILYTFANKLTTAGNTIILQYTAPIWVILFSALIFRKRPKRPDIIAVAFIFGGIICFFIDGISAGNMLGNVLALLSGVFYSGVFLMGTAEDADSLSSTFFGMCINVIVGIPFMIAQDYSDTGTAGWFALICLGVLQVGLAYVCLNIGLKSTPPLVASLVCALEPILNPILVALVFHEMLTPLSLVGAVVVFVTIIIYNIITARRGEQ